MPSSSQLQQFEVNTTMASGNKKRRENEESDYSSDPDDGNMSYDSGEDENLQEKVMVDFEARTPDDRDFSGIKRLLQQLFLKAHIDLSEMTNLILQQSHVSSVIQQSDDAEDSDMEENDDVFGLVSVLNMTDKKEVPCVQQLRTYLQSKCSENAKDSQVKLLQSILRDDSKHVGFIFNERFINIPPAIAVPSFENLLKEITAAKQKNMKFDFTYFMMLCKMYKPMPMQKGVAAGLETMYSNAEEELLEKDVDLSVDFSVLEESDAALSGKWDGDSDTPMKPFRRLFVFRADKLDAFIESMKINLATQ